MRKLKALFLCSCIILSLFIVAESKAQQPSQISNPQTKKHNENDFPNIFRPIGNFFKSLFNINRTIRETPSPEIRNIYLSQRTVIKQIPKRRSGAVCSETDQSIIVTTDAFEYSGDVLLYNYKVSGGEIIGKGSTVVWNLADAKPGKYTITVGVDNGCGVCHQPVTKEVEVIECESPLFFEAPSCPTGEVVANQSSVSEEQIVKFTANLKDFKGEPVFSWQVYDGEIISGQDTQTITVKAPSGTAGKTIKAYVTVKNVDPSCAIPAASVEVTKPINRSSDQLPPMICPVGQVVIPNKQQIKVGEIVTFTASVEGYKDVKFVYNWSVSAGEIIGGQYTPNLIVKATPESAEKDITAVAFVGNLDSTCNGASATVKVIKP